MIRRQRLFLSMVLGFAVVGAMSACEGKQATGAAPAGEAKGPAFDGKAAPAADAKAPAPPAKADAQPEAKAEAPKDLGERFMDPPWFRKHLFADATKVELHRTKADANGLFASNMRFILPSGQSPEECAKYLVEKVGAEVTNLESKKLDDGRFEIKGSTERYTVTMQCGAPKGELIAFVAYQWTS